MAHPPRREPLRAAEPEPASPSGTESRPATPDGEVPRSRLRGALVGIATGVGVGLAGVGIAFSIVAIPLYMLASVEPDHGLDRTFVRKGLFDVAVPFGVVAGIVIGLAVGLWYARGGRLPTDRTRLHDR